MSYVITVPDGQGGRRPLGPFAGVPFVYRSAEHASAHVAELEQVARSRGIRPPAYALESAASWTAPPVGAREA